MQEAQTQSQTQDQSSTIEIPIPPARKQKSDITMAEQPPSMDVEQPRMSDNELQIRQNMEELRKVEEELRDVKKEIDQVAQQVAVHLNDESQVTKYYMEKERQLRDKEKQLRVEKKLLMEREDKLKLIPTESGNPETLKGAFKEVEDKIQEAENLWDLAPCYQQLLNEFERIGRYNTLIVSGPKGCGKTSALILLAYHLRRNGKKAYYVDLGARNVAKSILQRLQKECSRSEQATLLIDNVQLFKNFLEFRFDDGVYTNVVAACSPGHNAEDIKPFYKERGDGKVFPVFFRPLNYDSALSFLKHKFPAKVAKSVEQPFPITNLTEETFAQLMYITGGVPRYLEGYLQEGTHIIMNPQEGTHNIIMDHELSSQIKDVLLHLTPEKLCELVVKIETTCISPPNPLIDFGIAYVDQNNQVRITSPMYLEYALTFNNLMIETRHDWQKLEMLTVFNLKFQVCVVENCQKNKFELPSPTQLVVQKRIGEISDQPVEGCVTLMELAPSHPVIDLLLIDKRSKRTEVYFIQVSFSTYKKHGKKRMDLETMNMIADKSVAAHYKQSLEYTKKYFIYATTEFRHKGSDAEVYFLDLSRQVFHKL